MGTKSKQVATESARALVESMLADIESSDGTGWIKPWVDMTMPTNATTDKAYRGSNVWTLTLAAINHGYVGAQWATYKQWQSVGVQVQRGESATKGLYAGPKVVADRDSDDPDATKTIWITRSFSLFHRDQTDADAVLGPLDFGEPIEPAGVETAAEVINRLGVETTEGSAAYYTPSTGVVTLPPADSFDSAGAYVHTVLHEVGHWTGHESRLDRHTGPTKFGSPAYAREELTVELAAVLAGARLGVEATDGHDEHRGQSVEYIASWLRAASDGDVTVIFDLLSDVEDVADMVMAEHAIGSDSVELAA